MLENKTHITTDLERVSSSLLSSFLRPVFNYLRSDALGWKALHVGYVNRRLLYCHLGNHE